MPQTFRYATCYRSMLFVPVHKLDRMLKAPKYGSDALILDLEDSVGMSEKPAARKAAAKAIKELRAKPIGLFYAACNAEIRQHSAEMFGSKIASDIYHPVAISA